MFKKPCKEVNKTPVVGFQGRSPIVNNPSPFVSGGILVFSIAILVFVLHETNILDHQFIIAKQFQMNINKNISSVITLSVVSGKNFFA